jgi:hypothetical protein
MNYYTEFEALESLLDSDGYESVFEMDESDESDESDEARRGRQRRRGAGPRPKVPSGQGLYKARPTGNYVTQVQLKSAMDRVGAQIKTNADATKAVNTRVNVANDRIDKEAATRKKEDAELNKKIKKGQEASLLPLLLQKAPEKETRTLSGVTVNGVAGQTVEVVTNVKQPSDNLLPLLLIMGMGGGMGSDDSSMGLMAVALLSR